MAHYELYICLKKDTYNSKVPDVLKAKLGWNEYEYDAEGEITSTTAYHPTWKESAFKGKLGAPRASLDGELIIVKGEFSMIEGELSAMAELGASMSYPNNSILTKSEAQELTRGELFTENE